jgi:polar amino acid transport system permease protein
MSVTGPASEIEDVPSAVVDFGGEPIKAVPVRHPGRWVSAAVVLLLVAWFAHSLVTSPGFQWDVVRHYFASPEILRGLWRTIELTVVAMALGISLGVVIAVMRLAGNPILSLAGGLYVWFFRGTPVLVQLIFWYNLASLYPNLSIGIPFGPQFVSGHSNVIITSFLAAMLGLGLNEGAYMAEIVRAGILSVDHGQIDASKALGFNSLLTMRRIVLPQAMRTIIPPTGNETIGMLKTSALASVVAVPELLQSTQLIYARTFQPIPLLIVASLWYLIVTTVLSFGQYYVERRFARGAARQLPPTPLMRVRQQLSSLRAQMEREVR